MAGAIASRQRRRLLALAILCVAGWLVFAAISAVLAGVELRSAKRAVEAARDKSSTTELADGRPIPDLREAQSSFQRAADRMAHPLLLPVQPLPVIGRQLRSVRDLSRAAATITDVGGDALEEVRTVLSAADLTPAERAPLVRQLGDLATRTERRLEGIRLGPDRGLIGPLADAHDEVAGQLFDLRAGLRHGRDAATAVGDLLAGPRRYLVLAANNAEMRAGSGMVLSAGELESQDGRLRLGDLKTVNDIPVPPGVPLPAELSDRWGWLKPNEDWTSLMVSPRFDAMAPVAAQMWVASGHRPVDGVLLVDPVTLSALLRATGPITVSDRQIDADNVVDELLRGQYFRFSNEDKVARRDDLGRIARAAFDAFDTGGWSPSRLAGSLVAAARGRHVMMWSARATEQAGWVAAGIDGGLRADSLLVAVQNRAGTKSDPFLSVHASLALHRDADGTEATLTLDLRNVIPPDQPAYIAGPHPGSGAVKDEYLGIVSVNLPAAAQQGRFDGVDALAVAGSDGPTRVIAFQLSLVTGAQRSVVARFRLPRGDGEFRLEPTARIPGLRWTYAGETWEDGRSRVVQW